MSMSMAVHMHIYVHGHEREHGHGYENDQENDYEHESEHKDNPGHEHDAKNQNAGTRRPHRHSVIVARPLPIVTEQSVSEQLQCAICSPEGRKTVPVRYIPTLSRHRMKCLFLVLP